VSIYVVARPLMGSSSFDLVGVISCIEVPLSRNIQVVAVDDLRNLPDLSQKKKWVEDGNVVHFSLNDFRNDRQQASLDQFTIDINLLARKMESFAGGWIVIDFDNDLMLNTLDFIRKFSRFIFLSEKIRGSKFLFLVDRHDVTFYAGRINESVNNIPVGPVEVRRSGALTSFHGKMLGVVLMRLLPNFMLRPLHRVARSVANFLIKKDLKFEKK